MRTLINKVKSTLTSALDLLGNNEYPREFINMSEDDRIKYAFDKKQSAEQEYNKCAQAIATVEATESKNPMDIEIEVARIEKVMVAHEEDIIKYDRYLSEVQERIDEDLANQCEDMDDAVAA
jgi:hypothetical protein